MRACAVAMLAAIGALAAGCDSGAVRANAARAQGYTLEVFAHADDRVYLVARSDGRETAARVRNGQSALIDPREAHGLIAQRAAALDPPGEADVSIRAPGFSLSVAANDSDVPNRDSARVEINVGGKSVLIDAADTATRQRALVRVVGADADAARNFIEEADGLSAETKAQMLRALGLLQTR